MQVYLWTGASFYQVASMTIQQRHEQPNRRAFLESIQLTILSTRQARGMPLRDDLRNPERRKAAELAVSQCLY